MTKTEIKTGIQKLIDKYESTKLAGKLKGYTEEETKQGFILPLFSLLGWDIEDKNEVSAEEHIKSSGRVDYGFYLNGRIAFYLEAKKLSADLHNEEFAHQAIRYSWNRAATWAVLTDFENIKVFNAQDIKRSLVDKQLFDISYSEFLTRFDELWLLSKESFSKNALNQYAEKVNKKYQKIPITETLYKDLNECRALLTDSLHKCNPKVKPHDLDEGVQKLLDRLIFLRVAEDRGVEPNILKQLLHQSKAAKHGSYLYEAMTDKFRELDEVYNSNLFSEHPFEKWEEFGGSTEKVIESLYGKKGYYEYDFKAMSADVLGTVYEHYLGYKLSQVKKHNLFNEKAVEVSKDAKKRKEQGIYYTPHFIVEYIVKNALGPVLQKCKDISDLKKIKVLDPACGSGSFLLEAFRLIAEKYKSFQCDDFETRVQILTENIYGVDLDPQAVEIARLNLLLAILDKRKKFPLLTSNIKCGNSLISGSDKELEKYFGKNLKDKRPFNWEEEFSDVFKEGGFDVVIGNPPYIRNRELEKENKEFFSREYVTASGQYDLYQLFFERSLKLCKTEGLIGFITSNKYTIADYGKKLRQYLLENSNIISMVDVSNLDVFKDAATYPYIIIFKKGTADRKNSISAYKPRSGTNLVEGEIKISQTKLNETESRQFILKEEKPLLKKIESVSEKLGDVSTIKETIHTGNVRNKLIVDEKLDENCKKLLAGKDCHRYHFEWNSKWIRYDKNLVNKKNKEYANLVSSEYFEKPKLLLREISYNLETCYDDEGYYTLNKVYSIQTKEPTEYKLSYLLALLNSKLLTFYFREKFEGAHVQNNYLQVKKIYSSQIPIRKINFLKPDEKMFHDDLTKLGENITNLYKELKNEENGSNKYELLKSEIEKTDRKIDEEVYKLYNLTPEEIKIVEGE